MSTAASPECYRFGRFELQPAERRLFAGGMPVEIGPRAFDLLLALVERAGHLVTKDQLLERVWPQVIVEENTLRAQVSLLRKILGADAIATVSAQGYRFTPEITYVEAPPASAAVTPNHNLPAPLTSFVGREKEIAHLKELLGSTRLLTLTGSGGCGKTRLAIRVAADVLQSHPDGVWLVELAALAEPRLVQQAVANVFRLKEQTGKSLLQTIAEYLGSRRSLLVLDNAEHLLDACAQLADSLLRRCAHVAILMTSRERVGIDGELTYRVPSLSMPDPERVVTPEELSAYESARLFVERARLQQPLFAVTVQNAPALASVCYRLDGIPLAIELAAPRVRSMSLEELDRGLDQRFGLLTGGSRTALPRHRTLRSLIDWSYALLSDSEQALLRRLSVFSGGLTLEAARQVCIGEGVQAAEMLDHLTSLADKNLLSTEEHQGATRYRLLETVRQYARDRLRESRGEEEWQRRHLAYFLALAEEAEPHLRGSGQEAWLDRLETEQENLRTALAWSSAALGADMTAGLRLAGALWLFWLIRGNLAEGSAWLRGFLAAPAGGRDTAEFAKALHGAGGLAYRQGEIAAARTLLEKCIALRRQLGDRQGLAASVGNLGNIAVDQRDYASARALYEEALVVARGVNDRPIMAVLLNNLGCVALEEGDHSAARTLLEESLAIRRELGDRRGIAESVINLWDVAHEQGDHAAARPLLEAGLAIFRELGDRWGIAGALERIAYTLGTAAPGRAARIWGGAERLREDIGAPLSNDRPRYERQVAAARAVLNDDAAFESAWQEGRAMTLEQAVRDALDASGGNER